VSAEQESIIIIIITSHSLPLLLLEVQNIVTISNPYKPLRYLTSMSIGKRPDGARYKKEVMVIFCHSD